MLVLFLFHVNVSSASGRLSPWFYGSTLGDCLPFREAELKHTAFSSLLLFRVFPLFLIPQRYSTFEWCLLGLLLNNNNNNITCLFESTSKTSTKFTLIFVNVDLYAG